MEFSGSFWGWWNYLFMLLIWTKYGDHEKISNMTWLSMRVYEMGISQKCGLMGSNVLGTHYVGHIGTIYDYIGHRLYKVLGIT